MLPNDLFQKILHMKEDVYAAATVKGTPGWSGYDIFDKDTQYTLTPVPMDEKFSGTKGWFESKSEKG